MTIVALPPAFVEFRPTADLVGISPCGCHVQLQDKRGRTTKYTVEVLPTAWDGLAARMTKENGDAYEVFVACNHQDHICDCLGFSQHGNCKHVGYVKFAWALGWLPGMTRPTQGKKIGTLEPDCPF